MKTITCYTDGSCNNKKTGPGAREGGFGIVLRAGQHKKDYFEGRYINTTSARMELMAVIRAIELCTKGWHIIIHTDNQYVQKTVEVGWLTNWIRKGILEEKANADLWKRFKKAYDEKGGKHFIKIKWVKGHAGNEFNELADELANKGRLMVETHQDIQD